MTQSVLGQFAAFDLKIMFADEAFVFLNGALIASSNSSEVASYYNRRLNVTLNEGMNVIAAEIRSHGTESIFDVEVSFTISI